MCTSTKKDLKKNSNRFKEIRIEKLKWIKDQKNKRKKERKKNERNKERKKERTKERKKW
jgi:hypothetical protein